MTRFCSHCRGGCLRASNRLTDTPPSRRHGPKRPAANIMNKKILPTLAAACSLLLGAPVFGQSYHSNDLTPVGKISGKLTGASGGKQVGGGTDALGASHAVLLTGNALSAVDLHPATGYYYSMATSSDDTQQGGWAYSYSGVHAMVWNGSSSSYSDLHPSGYSFSSCLGVYNGEQVGYAQNQVYFITASCAYIWHGTGASGVNLHPGTAPYSRALGVRNGEQVGYVSSVAYPDGDSLGYHTTSRAVRWAGTAASAVNLHPLAGYDASEAVCTNGTQQGGWGYLVLGTSHQHALLWSGTADTVLDLHPAAYTESRINALTADRQVGEGWVGTPGYPGSVRHALVWSGTADSVIDLNQYLPAGYTHGVATGIDASGNVVGYACNAYSTAAVPGGAIAVVFAPGAAPASGLASIAVSPANVAPGANVQVTVSLSSGAPAGGLPISFLSTNPTAFATPAPLTIAEGDTSATFTLPAGGAALTVPTSLKLYATDTAVSSAASLTVTPVVNLATVTANPVEGGFSTTATVSLTIPAQAGGAVVSLVSGNPALVAVPPSVTIPLGYTSSVVYLNTGGVTTATNVPITATFNGQSVTGNLAIAAAPVVSVASVTIPSMIGGQSVVGTVTLNNFARELAGAVVTLSSGDTKTLQVPATVTIPRGGTSATFNVTTSVVSGSKGVSVKATYNGGNLSTNVTVSPIPPVTILTADYYLDTHMFKVTASTPDANPILTYGTDVPVGTMQFELGQWKGSTILAGATPSIATVWSAVGASSSMPVRVRATAGGIVTGGAGTTATAFKLTVVTNGKGTASTSPTGTSFASGTVLTLTATATAGGTWTGWTGDVVSSANTITVTITKDTKLTANFR